MGYQQTVRQTLASQAEVISPEDNCRNSSIVLQNIEPWILRHQPDVVHVNAGLHDLCRDRQTGEVAVPLEQYKENIRTILKTLADHGITRVIWASTTPVDEKMHRQKKPFDRLEADVCNYNATAAAVAKDQGVPINDLYAVVAESGRDTLLGDDGVHFNEQGYAVLGRAVAQVVLSES